MNKFKFYFILTITSLFLFSCHDDDNSITYTPARDRQKQYDDDIVVIENYLNSYYIVNGGPVNNPGQTDDMDVSFALITDANTQPSIMSYLDAPGYPRLKTRTTTLHDVEYTIYYLILREGVGESPINVDGVLTSYSGSYIQENTDLPLSTVDFQTVIYPQTFFSLYTTITGWSEIFPQFKTGTIDTNSDGSDKYLDFGAGVMFIPSGLGYYNTGSGTIPGYASLIFSFKLYSIKRLDHDGDGVFSYQEDLNNDGYVYSYSGASKYPTKPEDGIRYADDTDKDGIPDFLDTDDDGDNYTTRLEITKPDDIDSGDSKYFPYDPTVDNPLTATVDETETKGIPSYSADYTTPGRLRIHVDKDHHSTQP